MQIFATSINPAKAAQHLDNVRLRKMVVETAQILCSALFKHGIETPYKPTHLQHPAVKWAAKTAGNWDWLFEYGNELAHEYARRSGRVHKTTEVYKILTGKSCYLPQGTRLNFWNGTGINGVPIEQAYLMYLNDKWDADKKEPTWGVYYEINK
jgi:hypothetical protein